MNEFTKLLINLFLVVACFILVQFYEKNKDWKPQVELYYPALDHGARIPGTNYAVDGKDTLEIVKYVDYEYRILNQAERKQAREYIKSLRK